MSSYFYERAMSSLLLPTWHLQGERTGWGTFTPHIILATPSRSAATYGWGQGGIPEGTALGRRSRQSPMEVQLTLSHTDAPGGGIFRASKNWQIGDTQAGSRSPEFKSRGLSICCNPWRLLLLSVSVLHVK